MKRVKLSKKKAKRVIRFWTAIQHQCGWCGELTEHRCKELYRLIQKG